MPATSRWLVLRAGDVLIAAPAAQVRQILPKELAPPADSDADAPRDLRERLVGSPADAGRLVLLLRSRMSDAPLQVSAVEEIVDGPELVPLPALLSRGLGPNPIYGFIFWRGRPVPVVDLVRCVELPGE